MPSATFFNLPGEKRRRLLDAAWEEMTAVSFDKVSINRIIQDAGIPRGSFYQYFTDKLDLFRFLLSDGLEEIDFSGSAQLFCGDLFESCLAGYDWMMEKKDNPRLQLLVQLVQKNPEMELPLDFGFHQSMEQMACMGAAQTYDLWKTDEITVEDHMELLCTVVGGAIIRSFRCPEKSGQIRRQLQKQLMILKRGMLDTRAKGEQQA